VNEDELSARFVALKGSHGIPAYPKLSSSGDDDDATGDEENEVEKLIQWAKDAAHLELSPSSDNDDDRATLAAMSATSEEQRESIEREEDEENGRRRRGGGAEVKVFVCFFFFPVFSLLYRLYLGPFGLFPRSTHHTLHAVQRKNQKKIWPCDLIAGLTME